MLLATEEEFGVESTIGEICRGRKNLCHHRSIAVHKTLRRSSGNS